MLFQPLKMRASFCWGVGGGGESCRMEQGWASGGLLGDCRAGDAQRGGASLSARPRLRAPALPAADLWPRGGHPKEPTAMTSPLAVSAQQEMLSASPLPA